MRAWFAAGVVMSCALACDRGHREPLPSSTAPSAPSAATAPVPLPSACTLPPIPVRIPAPERLVAIGDIHGDLAAARAAFRAAGAIDRDDHWIGGNLVVVQTGDVLDRGDDESAILELLERLDREARAAGGALIELLGNHELMNAAHDFRYVTAAGMRDFGGDRATALAPGSAWAKRLANHDVVMIVGDVVLSHAGVLGAWAGQVEDVNRDARCWLDGQRAGPALALTADDSPVWTRELGIEGQVDCAKLDAALSVLQAHRMVVGHTVQHQGITSACDGKLWRIDVGLAKVYGGPIEVLELSAPPRVIEGKRE